MYPLKSEPHFYPMTNMIANGGLGMPPMTHWSAPFTVGGFMPPMMQTVASGPLNIHFNGLAPSSVPTTVGAPANPSLMTAPDQTDGTGKRKANEVEASAERVVKRKVSLSAESPAQADKGKQPYNEVGTQSTAEDTGEVAGEGTLSQSMTYLREFGFSAGFLHDLLNQPKGYELTLSLSDQLKGVNSEVGRLLRPNDVAPDQSVDRLDREAVVAKLNALGYSDKDIDKIAKHDAMGRPHNALKVVAKYHDALLSRGYTPDDVMRLGLTKGSHVTIDKLLNSSYEPHCFNLLSKHDFLRIVGNSGGHVNLQSYVDSREGVMALGFSHDDVVNLLSRDGGRLCVKGVLENARRALELGLSHDDIIKISAHHSGGKGLKLLCDHFPTLKQAGISLEDAVTIGRANGPVQRIMGLVTAASLVDRGLPKARFSQIGKHSLGAKYLNYLNANAEAFDRAFKGDWSKIAAYGNSRTLGNTRSLEALVAQLNGIIANA